MYIVSFVSISQSVVSYIIYSNFLCIDFEESNNETLRSSWGFWTHTLSQQYQEDIRGCLCGGEYWLLTCTFSQFAALTQWFAYFAALISKTQERRGIWPFLIKIFKNQLDARWCYDYIIYLRHINLKTEPLRMMSIYIVYSRLWSQWKKLQLNLRTTFQILNEGVKKYIVIFFHYWTPKASAELLKDHQITIPNKVLCYKTHTVEKLQARHQ